MVTTFASDPAWVFTRQISTPGLGNHSYVIGVGRQAVIIDPQRDTDRYDAVLKENGTELVAVLETHIHNDYVSGGAVLARRHGAAYCLPAETDAMVQHQELADGDQFPLGDWRLTAMHTPGHTPHHMSYALVGPDGPVAVFTGGSMLVGAVGRTDLFGEELAEKLARDQYQSVRRLATELPDVASVHPTHGSRSFCAAGEGAGETASTIGMQRMQNPALLARDETSFANQLLGTRPLYPTYFARMAPINRVGAAPMSAEPPRRLTPTDLAALDGENWIVDLRTPDRFAEAHIPQSVNIPASDDVATYVGWLVPWGAPRVLVAESEHDLAQARTQLARIGIDSLVGAVTDGLDAWRAEDRPVASHRTATFAELAAERPRTIVDVRDPVEVRDAPLDGARNIHVGQLLERAHELPDGELWVHCTSGFRAAIAASLLQRLGWSVVAVIDDIEPYLSGK